LGKPEARTQGINEVPSGKADRDTGDKDISFRSVQPGTEGIDAQRCAGQVQKSKLKNMEADFNIARMKASLEMAEFARLIVKATLIELGHEKATVIQQFLFDKHGRRKIEKLKALGLIVGNKTGLSKSSSVEFDAMEVEAVLAPENRSFYVALVREQEAINSTK